jgi:DNA repair photolyase
MSHHIHAQLSWRFMSNLPPDSPIKGRGALTNRSSRFDSWSRTPELESEVSEPSEFAPGPLKTEVREDPARSIISRNQSPDIPFEQSINPYKGCEHGCVYCYARPTHAYLGLSAGLDFETKLFYKANAAQLLAAELSKPGYRPSPIALGANTDPYQPIEKRLQTTRSLLQILSEFQHPLTIVTKSALVERDLDILAPMARLGLVRIYFSIATLDQDIARRMEPRAAAPARRLEAIQRVTAAGVPAGVLVAPVVPALTDKDIEAVLEAAATAGASDAGYVLLRLPREVRDLFVEWLEQHYPLRAKHVMSLLQQMRDGKDNDPDFGTRMRGTGLFADLIRRRFESAVRRLHLNSERSSLDSRLFRVPAPTTGQLQLDL